MSIRRAIGARLVAGTTERPAVTLTSPSTLALIAANVVPMAGLCLWGWNISDVLRLGLGEAVVIGVYTLIKAGVADGLLFLLRGPLAAFAFAFILLWLFGVIEMTAHEIDRLATGSYRRPDYVAIARDLAPALAAFVASHGVSFVTDFVGRREYRHRDSERIAITFFRHLVPLFAMALTTAFIVAAFGNVGAWFIIVIAIKLGLDLVAHLGEPGTPQPAAPENPLPRSAVLLARRKPG